MTFDNPLFLGSNFPKFFDTRRLFDYAIWVRNQFYSEKRRHNPFRGCQPSFTLQPNLETGLQIRTKIPILYSRGTNIHHFPYDVTVMFQETTSTTTKGSPESEREKEGKDMQSPILKLPSIGTILKEKEQFSTESERTKTFTLQQDKSRVHSEYQPSWKASSSIQPLPEQAELKTTEKSSQEYELFPHFLSEDVVRGFQMPPLKSTTIYSERCVRPTASAKQLVKDFSGTRKTLEAGEYSVTSKTTELKEEVAERRTGGYAGLGVTGSSGYSESSKKLFIGSSTVGELSKIPRLQISSILEERKPTGKTVSVSSSDWKEIGEGSFDSHSVEEPIASIDPRSMLASSSTSKLSSQVLSEKDKHALRLMRNRLSAERSRNRKRQRMQTLEQEVREKEETIGLLREDMNALLRYVERLEAFCKVLDVPSSELTRPELNYKP